MWRAWWRGELFLLHHLKTGVLIEPVVWNGVNCGRKKYIEVHRGSRSALSAGARAAGMSTFKAHVKTVDMSEEMEADAISIAAEAIMTCSVEKDMAAYVCRRSASLVALRCSC